MPCYHPITGYRRSPGDALQWHNPGDCDAIEIPCGQCIGCRLRISREWAIRCVHEAQMHKHNCTVTLTYDDEHLPKNSSLEYRDFQLFMKNLRKALGRGEPGLAHTSAAVKRVRFYMGGEYGEERQRPHFHACLFGIHFKDKIYNRQTEAGSKLYTSKTLDKIWKKGFASIGELTFESAAYIARYIMKKRTGKGSEKSYETADMETGEIIIRKKEFNQMSRKPGIGAAWLEKYHRDVYPHGKVVMRGHQVNTPRYYDKKNKELNALEMEDLTWKREQEANAQREHHTPERLAVQEQVKLASIKSLKRKLQ